MTNTITVRREKSISVSARLSITVSNAISPESRLTFLVDYSDASYEVRDVISFFSSSFLFPISIHFSDFCNWTVSTDYGSSYVK